MSLSDVFFSPRHLLGYRAASSRGMSSCKKKPIICGFGNMSLPIRNPFVPILESNIDFHTERTTSTISSWARGWLSNNFFVISSHRLGFSPLYGDGITKFPPQDRKQSPLTHERSPQYSEGSHFAHHVQLHRYRFGEDRKFQQVLLVTSRHFFSETPDVLTKGCFGISIHGKNIDKRCLKVYRL